jgi:hypothetical protein
MNLLEMAIPNVYVTASTSLLQVTPPISVLLSSINSPGQLITIRDYLGQCSPTSKITISTTQGLQFLDGPGVKYELTQPYSFLTVTPKSENIWAVQNSFAYQNQSVAIISNLTSKLFIGSTIYNDTFLSSAQVFASSIGVNCNSPTYPLDVNGILNFQTLYQDGRPFVADGNISTINSSTINVNELLTVGPLNVYNGTPVSPPPNINILEVQSNYLNFNNNTLFVSTNRVGINTTTPQTALDISGVLMASSYQQKNVLFPSGPSTATLTLTSNTALVNSLPLASFETIQSSIAGLGSSGYVSSFSLQSTVRGLGSAGYVSTPSLQSTVTGLASIGYISTSALTSTVAGLQGTTVTSTVTGLGSVGYVSSLSLQSTVRGLASSGYVSSLSLQSTVTGLASSGYVSSLSLQSTVRGLASAGYVSSLSLVSTVQGLASSGYVSTLSLQSTLTGLASLGYISTASLQSTVTGLRSNGSFSSIITSSITSIVNPLTPINITGYVNVRTNSSNIWFFGTTNSTQVSSNASTWQTLGATGGFGGAIINTIAFNGNYFLAAGSTGSLYSNSSPTTNWSPITATGTRPSTQTILMWSGSFFFLGGNGLSRSADSLSWTSLTTQTITNVNDIAFDGYRMVLVGTHTTNTIQYSLDHGSTWSTSSGVFTTGGNGIATNGRVWVAVGEGGATIKYSYDAINFINVSSGTFSTRGNKVTWNGSSFIAIGEDTAGKSIKISIDGVNWSDTTTPPGTTVTPLSVAWNGSQFVVAGSNSGGNGVYYTSPTGATWTSNATAFSSLPLRVVAFSSNVHPDFRVEQLSFFNKNQFNTLTSTNNIYIGNSTLNINSALLIDRGTGYVGINCNSPQYNLDVNGTIRCSEIIANILPGTVTPANLVSTTVGLSEAGYVSSLSLQSTVRGLGSIGYVSTTGLDTALRSTVGGLGNSTYISSLSLQSTILGLGYVTGGQTGYISTSALTSTVQSLQTLFTTSSIKTSSILAQDSQYGIVNMNSFVNIKNNFTSNVWVAYGDSGSTPFTYSLNNGSTWTAVTGGPGSTTSANTSIAWNGSNFIGFASPSGILGSWRSSDGISWSSNAISGSIPQSVKDIIWTGSFFIAVGSNLNGGTIARSVDGITWSSANTTFSNTAGVTGVNFDGTRMVVAGTPFSPSATNTLQYSDDQGVNWNTTTGAFSNVGSAVATNGKIWVAVGSNNTVNQSIKYSYNGINWSNASNQFAGSCGYDVTWNGNLFVAVGRGSGVSGSTTALLYSYDGINWSDATGDTVTGNTSLSVSWNGSVFLADGGSGNTIRSSDGINWSSVGSTSLTQIRGFAFTSNVTPDLQLDNLSFYGKGQYSINQSTNSIHLAPSSLTIDNTLRIGRDGRVGINTGNPTVALDVIGDVNISGSLNATNVTGFVTTNNLTSTVQGLATSGYVSSLSLQSTVTGIQVNNINSTVQGLATSGYVSSLSMASTVTGIQVNNINSTVRGLASSGYVSSLSLASTVTGIQVNNINSTVQGLATSGYVSSLSMASTVTGIQVNNINSTVRGLASSGYVSSLTLQTSLQSTVSGMTNGSFGATLFSTLSLNASSINVGVINASLLSTLTLNTSNIKAVSTLKLEGGLDVGKFNSTNMIRFSGTTGDAGNYSYTSIGERIYGASEQSELILFKGNDAVASGPDRVRVLASGGFQVDTGNTMTWDGYAPPPTAAYPNALFVSGANGRVGIGKDTPAYTLDISGSVQLNSNLFFSNTTANATVSYLNPTFTQETSGTVRTYSSVSMSSDGKYQIAAQTTNQIARSVDYGNTWLVVATAGSNYFQTAMSYEGQNQYVSISGSRLITRSTNYGSTWTNTTALAIGSTIWGVACSSDGSIVIATHATSSTTIRVSNDFGVNWAIGTSVNSTGGIQRGCAMSASGKYVAVLYPTTDPSSTTSGIYISTDYGSTWTKRGSALDWYNIAISETGQYMVAVPANDTIYVSSNYGTTWSSKGVSGSYTRCSISPSGQYMVASTNGSIYVSKNFGTTWTDTNVTSRNYDGIAISENGSYITSAVNGDYIYRSLGTLGYTINSSNGINIATTAPLTVGSNGSGITHTVYDNLAVDNKITASNYNTFSGTVYIASGATSGTLFTANKVGLLNIFIHSESRTNGNYYSRFWGIAHTSGNFYVYDMGGNTTSAPSLVWSLSSSNVVFSINNNTGTPQNFVYSFMYMCALDTI